MPLMIKYRSASRLKPDLTLLTTVSACSYTRSLILTELLADLLWGQSYLTASDPNLIWEDLFESSSGDRMLRLSRRKHVSLDTLKRLVKLLNHKTLNYSDRPSFYPRLGSLFPKISRTDSVCFNYEQYVSRLRFWQSRSLRDMFLLKLKKV